MNSARGHQIDDVYSTSKSITTSYYIGLLHNLEVYNVSFGNLSSSKYAYTSCDQQGGSLSTMFQSGLEIGIFSSGQVTTTRDGKEFLLGGILMTILL